MSSLPVPKSGAIAPANGVSPTTAPVKESSRVEAANRALLQRRLEELVVLARESTAADGAAIALREGGQFLCRASQGFAPEPGVVVEPGQGVCGRCIIDARVLVCQDLSGDVKSALAAPVIVGDEIEGLIATFSFRQSAFNSDHIDLVSRMAVDIGNQVASPETIHLVPRDPVSILNDPRADVIAVDDVSLPNREKHLEILGDVTAPTLPGEVSDNTVRPTNGAPQAASEIASEPAFHFLGYDSAKPEPEAPAKSELLGDYLSKWDIAIIFSAILVAMLAFSLYLHHRKSQVYTAPYVPEATDLQPAGKSSESSPAPDTAKTKATKEIPAKSHTEKSSKPLPISGGRINQDDLPSPSLQVAGGSVNAVSKPVALPDPAAGITGPSAPAVLVHKVDPTYPASAHSGSQVVTLDLKVGSNGKVGMIKVVGGNNPFVSAALNAVRQWRYEPATQNGNKVESSVRVDVGFNPDTN